MPLCPRTPVSDYMCWHSAGGKAFASMMWKRKDVNTWTWVLLIAFQCVDLKLTTKGSPYAFQSIGNSRFSWKCISFSDARWVEREGEENTRKRSLIEPRKVGKFALILMGSTQEDPESELGRSCKTALDFSKVIICGCWQSKKNKNVTREITSTVKVRLKGPLVSWPNLNKIDNYKFCSWKLDAKATIHSPGKRYANSF